MVAAHLAFSTQCNFCKSIPPYIRKRSSTLSLTDDKSRLIQATMKCAPKPNALWQFQKVNSYVPMIHRFFTDTRLYIANLPLASFLSSSPTNFAPGLLQLLTFRGWWIVVILHLPEKKKSSKFQLKMFKNENEWKNVRSEILWTSFATTLTSERSKFVDSTNI